ncbi:MAG: translation elongation factor 4 [Mycoplasmoidaceae bacterium]
MNKQNIRNFCIIAHIDHGKSTLSDRIIECASDNKIHNMQDQVLDSMELERERGITIKLNAIQLKYHSKKHNSDFIFHLIDTPGHVDFTYEVSRSLAACEGAILVVDATQGVQAQTISNLYLALDNNLSVFPVINKIDLPSADVEKCKKQIKDILGIDATDAPCVSAKTGQNIYDIVEAVIDKIPAPVEDDDNKPLQALIFDSYYDSYLGAVCYIRVKNGSIKVGDKIKMMASGATFIVTSLGVKTPIVVEKKQLNAGEVGWVAASIKTIKDVAVGDTITTVDNPAKEPLPGYKKVLPMVYCGFYPIDNSKYEELKIAIEKISLSDAALVYEYETSQSLGFGVRCGFLGLLHMDIIQERISREYKIDLIVTAPSVKFLIDLTNRTTVEVDNPAKFPERTRIDQIREPYVKVSIFTPDDYIGDLMALCQNARGKYIDLETIDNNRKCIVYEIPLIEVIYNFFDRLKSVSRGYATMEYELIGYQPSDLVKVDILLNGKKTDALSFICHRSQAYHKAQRICLKLKENIPRQQFEVPIQAAIGSKIIARENIRAMYKNVLAKCYGGDVSRKKKLLAQQKEGKKKLKAIGNVEVPQDVFIKILNEDE